MQTLDLSDTNLRSNCVVIAKAMFEGGMCSINQFEEFQFALQGTPTSNMSSSLHQLNITDGSVSKAIHDCFHILGSLMDWLRQTNELNPQIVHDTSCQWKKSCHEAGVGLQTDDATVVVILSSLLFQLGDAMGSKLAAILENTSYCESHDSFQGRINQLLLWLSLYDCFFTHIDIDFWLLEKLNRLFQK